MGGEQKGLRDFPASHEPFGGLLDEGPGKETPKKVLPADKESTDKAVANLKRLTGFTAPTDADQQPLPPVRIFVGHDSRPPTVPEQPIASTPGERSKNIIDTRIDKVNLILNQGGLGGEIARERLLGPIASHEASRQRSEQREERRKNLRLPKKALGFKIRLKQINALTPEDLIIIKEKLGYKPERIHQYAPLTQEIILHRLHEYEDWKQKQRTKV
ncbi:MAG: hypothetical protein NTY06_00025 [Candidatus Gottesmanbacteria bacterium]|nr:hypothetical protein [Candidatus Gottesmanbacteria bacterium]